MNTNELQFAIDFYEQGNSMAATCKKFHTTSKTLKKLLNDANIHIRNNREQLIIENIKRTKGVNHYYFSKPNNENMYYIGFLAADGTVRKSRNEIKVALSSIDKNFLLNMKKNLQIEKDVKTYFANNGFEYCELTFSSMQIKNDLAKYKVVPNKTIKGLSLEVIPDEYKMFFIKGFFDGDGSFSYNKNTKQAKITFTSHTKKILEDIKNYFNSGYIYQDKRNKVYSLEFSTLKSLDIMKDFYKIDSPCLIRKKEKYLKCLELRNNNPRDRIS